VTIEKTRFVDSLPGALVSTRKTLQRLLWRRVPASDAEDIIQEVYLRLIAAERSQIVKDPNGYIYSVVGRLLHDRRNRRRRGVAPAEELIDDRAEESARSGSTSDVESEVDTQQRLERAFGALPSTTRELLLLKLSGQSVSDIATAQRLPVRAVRKRLAQGLASIAMHLTTHGEPKSEGI
jgi:RNA polymerase sigma factor (sigma-70 family)